MKLRRTVKRQARKALREHKREGAAVFLLWGMMWLLVALSDRGVYLLAGCSPDVPLAPEALLISAITLVLRVILLAPLGAGAAAWFAALANGRIRPVATVFWAYGNRVWLRSLWVRVCAAFLTGAVALVPLAGGGFSLWLLRERLAALPPREQALAAALAGAAGLGWLLVAWAYHQRFAMALFLLGPDYGCSAAGALSLSAEYTWGHRWRLVWLDITFLPWFAACLLVFPALYVLPYYAAVRARYFSVLIRRRSALRRRTQPEVSSPGQRTDSRRMPATP